MRRGAVTVDLDVLDSLLSCAVRYALARRTYAAAEVGFILDSYAQYLSLKTRERILREIEEGSAGTEGWDRVCWNHIADHLRGLQNEDSRGRDGGVDSRAGEEPEEAG